MKILIFGAGAIGTIYGYVLSNSGNEVVHYVRPDRAQQLSQGLQVSLLDGRFDKKGKEVKGLYQIKTITKFDDQKKFDLILVSIKHGSLNEAVRIIKENELAGNILFFNGLWKDYSSMDDLIARNRYLWGYPVAGGNIDYQTQKLEGAIFDHIIMNETNGTKTERIDQIEKMFGDAGIQVERPENVLHWIWIHMAINVGVISTGLKYGSAAALMDSAKALREGIRTMREALKVAEARGVNLSSFREETRMFYLPVLLSGILFKLYFQKNILSRRIMELHSNMDDLCELCSDVYRTAGELGIDVPLLAQKKKYFIKNRSEESM